MIGAIEIGVVHDHVPTGRGLKSVRDWDYGSNVHWCENVQPP